MSDIKLHFEDPFQIKEMEYQKDAISAVVDLFRGQENGRSEFTVIKPVKAQVSFAEAIEVSQDVSKEQVQQMMLDQENTSELGLGNRLTLIEDELLENLREIQIRNGVKVSEALSRRDLNFTIGMETGTGKTYVYLRTIFELNRIYGFTKFIIVVPSVAIKEGTHATLRQTTEHFKALYPSAADYRHFAYNSSQMNDIRSFATSSSIEIMVSTVNALYDNNATLFHQPNEQTGGARPVDLIREMKPIVIVDEPQSVDGGDKGEGRKAIDSLNPLCTLRYSATHANEFHPLYRLDSVEAYRLGLVKQIEVASLEVIGDHNRAYVRLISVEGGGKKPLIAKVELDKQSKNGQVNRTIISVSQGDDLEQVTGRELYRDCRIGQLKKGTKAKPASIVLMIPNNELILHEDEGINGVDGKDIARLMIRRTINEHLDKEIIMQEKGQKIKVLSLFFIDSVEKYRSYNDEGQLVKGEYATIFEEEYANALSDVNYNSLFKNIDTTLLPQQVHDGYFSIDKRKVSNKGKESIEQQIHTPFNESTLKGNKEEQATSSYNLIMKEKEKLLSFDTKLKFIFSHSALREGWDNPNVFQICNLREMRTERERRQTIGRGLRLCVNQEGKRIRGFDTNILTVIANESYEIFADRLQREIEQETGVVFGKVEDYQFASIPVYLPESDTYEPLGVEESEAIYEYLKEEEYIEKTANGWLVTEKLKQTLQDNTFALPEGTKGKAVEKEVREVLVHLTSKVQIRNRKDRETVKFVKERALDPRFAELWDRIKYKTTYRVQFNDTELIKNCTDAVMRMPGIMKVQTRFVKANIGIEEGGVTASEGPNSGFVDLKQSSVLLPDVITELEAKTKMTRSSIVTILKQCKRLNDFEQNPQKFIQLASEAINRTKRHLLVKGIQYKKIGDTAFYAQEMLETEELTGYLSNMLEAKKSIYSHVVFDSQGVEKSFAEDLEKNEQVKVFVKLPGWFKVPTPLGTYNPDWAIVAEVDGKDRLYFVVETKGSLWLDDLHHSESGKIKCAEKHFESIAVMENPVKYVTATSLNECLS